jgi:hypothetical protein
VDINVRPKVELLHRLERTAAGLRELKFPSVAALLEESAAELRTVIAANTYWREEREHCVEERHTLRRQREVLAHELRALARQWREAGTSRLALPHTLDGDTVLLTVDGATYAAITAVETCAETLEAFVTSHFPLPN